MKRLIKYSCIAFFILGQFSCSNWLDIGSEDRIMEKDLFSTKDGFLTALNGVYIELLDNSLYGSTLTWGAADILAQYYDCSDEDHIYRSLSRFDAEVKNKQFESTWSKAWFLINNVNTLIEHCDEGKAVLDEASYHIIKGEALGLRGLLHFELFRIFGPVYSIDPDQKCMPYARSSDLTVLEMLTAEQVQDYILKDFRAAEQLLAVSDPVITEGALFSDAENGLSNAMRYRSLRLNYYAVQAYIARLALYVGNTSLASEYAEKVIRETQVEHEWFPFIASDAALDPDRKDRIYQPEVLFGLYHLSRKQIYEANFSNNLAHTRVLRPTDDYIDWMYDQNLNDYRYTQQWESMTDPENVEEHHKFLVKYMETADGGKGFNYLMPLMRISEMYLIAAECQEEESLQYEYLNKLRNARRIEDLEAGGNILEAIEKEYRKEFIGEGQLFWFYKRRNQNEIVAGSEEYIPVQKENYLFRLPQAEQDHRGTTY